MQGTKLLVCHASYYKPVAWLLRLRWRIAILVSAFFRYTSILKTRWILVLLSVASALTLHRKRKNLAWPRTVKIRISILSCNRKMLITHVAFGAMMETDSRESWNT